MSAALRPAASPVVVGIDGSDDGLRAVDYAVAEAQLRRAPLHLVSAVPVGSGDMFGLAVPSFDPDAMVSAAATAVNAAARRARATGLSGSSVSTEVIMGQPGEVLTRLSSQAEAVVLGRRGIVGLERMFAGSTSVAVSARAACPVLVVPHGWRPSARRRGIGVGIDGSPRSWPALALAFAEADLRGVDLTVIHAWEPPEIEMSAVGHFEKLRADFVEQANLAMAETLAGWQADQPAVPVQRTVALSHPVHALVEASRDLDLLVVGTSGFGAPSGFTLGTVARAVLAGAACPLALIRRGSGDADPARGETAYGSARQPLGGPRTGAGHRS